MTEQLESALKGACDTLNEIVKRKHAAQGYVHPADFIHYKERTKTVAIDVGSSGAWLVDKATGDVFNIKGYGVIDRRKKVGNIYSMDCEAMHNKRWQYLR